MCEVNARIKAIPHFAEILRSCIYDGIDTEIHSLEKEAKKGVVAMHRFKGTYDGFNVEVVIRNKGAKQFLYEIKFIEKEKSPQQSMTDESASPAPLGDAENKPIITHSEKKSNTPRGNPYHFFETQMAFYQHRRRKNTLDEFLYGVISLFFSPYKICY